VLGRVFPWQKNILSVVSCSISKFKTDQKIAIIYKYGIAVQLSVHVYMYICRFRSYTKVPSSSSALPSKFLFPSSNSHFLQSTSMWVLPFPKLSNHLLYVCLTYVRLPILSLSFLPVGSKKWYNTFNVVSILIEILSTWSQFQLIYGYKTYLIISYYFPLCILI